MVPKSFTKCSSLPINDPIISVSSLIKKVYFSNFVESVCFEFVRKIVKLMMECKVLVLGGHSPTI